MIYAEELARLARAGRPNVRIVVRAGPLDPDVLDPLLSSAAGAERGAERVLERLRSAREHRRGAREERVEHVGVVRASRASSSA